MNENQARISTGTRWFRVAAYTAILVLFFLLRVDHLRTILANPPGQIPIIDSLYYLRWAERILKGLGLGPHPFFMSPLYPLFITLSTKLAGPPPAMATLYLQLVLSAASMLLIGRFAARRFGAWSGPVAALLYAVYAPSIYYDGALLTSTLILFFTLVALTFLDDPAGRPKLWHTLMAGLAIGLSALARPSALILLPAFSTLLVIRGKKSGWVRTGLLVLGTLIVISPALVRNLRMGGEFSLTTNSAGINFFIGNHEGANGLYSEVPWLTSAEPFYESADYQHEAERRTGREMDLGRASWYWFGQAFSWGVHHPLAWANLIAHKFVYFFNRTEAPNNVSFYGTRDYSPILREFSFFNFGLVAPFALIGLLLGWRDRKTLIAYALVAGYLFVGLAFFVASEYRYPILAVMIPFAVGGAARIVRIFRRGDLVGGIQTVTVLLLLILAVNVPWKVMRTVSSPRMDYFNWAAVSYRNGDLANASLLFSAALAKDPGWTEAHMQLALVFEDMGMKDMADKEFKAAGVNQNDVWSMRVYNEMKQSNLPDSLSKNLGTMTPDELALLGQRFNQLGKYNAAKSVLSKALAEDSTNVRARFEYGLALESTGQRHNAIDVYTALEHLVPHDPLVPYRMAWCYFETGDAGTARSTLRRVAKKVDELPDEESRARWHALIKRTRQQFLNY